MVDETPTMVSTTINTDIIKKYVGFTLFLYKAIYGGVILYNLWEYIINNSNDLFDKNDNGQLYTFMVMFSVSISLSIILGYIDMSRKNMNCLDVIIMVYEMVTYILAFTIYQMSSINSSQVNFIVFNYIIYYSIIYGIFILCGIILCIIMCIGKIKKKNRNKRTREIPQLESFSQLEVMCNPISSTTLNNNITV
jgi:hypothetical protein